VFTHDLVAIAERRNVGKINNKCTQSTCLLSSFMCAITGQVRFLYEIKLFLTSVANIIGKLCTIDKNKVCSAKRLKTLQRSHDSSPTIILPRCHFKQVTYDFTYASLIYVNLPTAHVFSFLYFNLSQFTRVLVFTDLMERNARV
jgi:hypothetical protein